MAETRKKVSLNSLPKVLWVFLAYQILALIFDFVSLSFSTFIHFSLKHPVPIIEEWLVDHSWHIVLLGKCLAFMIVYQGGLSLTHRDKLTWAWWRTFLFKPNLHLYIGAVSSTCILFAFSSKDSNFSWVHSWSISILGTLGMFLLDYLMWHFLLKCFPPDEDDLPVLFWGPVMIFVFSSFARLAYLQKLNFWSVFLAILLFGLRKKDYAVHFLLLMVLPIVFLFNGDFAIAAQNSFFKLKSPFLTAVVVFAILAIYWKRRGIWSTKIDDTQFNSDNIN